MNPEFGTIERVRLSEVWSDEARDFTPWLSGNLDKLSDPLGIELALEDTEAPVGRFRLDILAREIPTSGRVAIENQYGTSDHGHLGKMLTYAAGYDVVKCIWITEEFSDEHKKVLDKLNGSASQEFYGVIIELLRIGDSLPALNFDIVVAPSNWSDASARGKNAGQQARNWEFIEKLRGKLRQKGLPEGRGTRNDRSSYRIIEYPVSNRVRYALIWHSFEPGKSKPGVEMVIEGDSLDWNRRLFEGLEQNKARIEKELAESEDEWIAWEPPETPMRGRKITRGRVAVYRSGNVHNCEKESWDVFQEWMIQKILLFREVFGPRLAELVE